MIPNSLDDRRPINRSVVNLGFSLALVIGVVIAAIIFFSMSRLAQERDLIAHTYIVLSKLDGVLPMLRTAESTQRDYVITSSATSLSAFQTAVDALPPGIAQLRQLVSDNASQLSRLDELALLISGRLDFLQQGIRASQEQGFAAAQKLMLVDNGQPTLGQIRTLVAAMENEENSLLVQRNEQSHASVLGAMGPRRWILSSERALTPKGSIETPESSCSI